MVQDVNPLTFDMILKGRVSSNYYPREIENILCKEGYSNLGWLGCITCSFEIVYSNQSGSHIIMVNHTDKKYYCIDASSTQIGIAILIPTCSGCIEYPWMD